MKELREHRNRTIHGESTPQLAINWLLALAISLIAGLLSTSIYSAPRDIFTVITPYLSFAVLVPLLIGVIAFLYLRRTAPCMSSEALSELLIDAFDDALEHSRMNPAFKEKATPERRWDS